MYANLKGRCDTQAAPRFVENGVLSADTRTALYPCAFISGSVSGCSDDSYAARVSSAWTASTPIAVPAILIYDRSDLAIDDKAARFKHPKKRQRIMGDKSPKSVHKQAAQKQVKSNAAAQKKQQAASAKQMTGKR